MSIMSFHRYLIVLLVMLMGSTAVWAAGPASLHGTVTDAAGIPIAGALVRVTNAATGATASAVTGPDGTFDLSGLMSGTYNVTSSMAGFADHTQNAVILQSGQNLSLLIPMKVSALAQSVTVTAEGNPDTSVTEATISRAQIEAVAGPFGSAAQALTSAPGIFVYSYAGVAATGRSEVEIRGIKGGWNSVNGDILNNGLMFTLDGIPMNNMVASNGSWQTTQIPITDMISDINVDYGPGAPSNRWYDSLGATVNYVPVQPKMTPGFSMTAGEDIGSYNTYLEHFIARTGDYKDWSGILAFGYASNDTFRVGTTGIPTFNAPSSGYASLAKVEKIFDRGNFSVGYYHSRNTEFRPNFLPITPITPASNNNTGDAVTTTGLYGPDAAPSRAIPAGIEYYSQATSGYYSSLAKALWHKQIKMQSDIVYGKLQLALSPRLTFDSQVWYRHGYRLHNRVVNFYGPKYADPDEYYDPATNVVGDKSDWNLTVPHNLITVGGYWMNNDYQTKLAIWNSGLGENRFNPPFFGAFHIYNEYGFLFIQDRIDLFSKRIVVTPGLAEQLFRTSLFNTSLSEFPAENPANLIFPAPNANKALTQLSPSVGARYLPKDWLTLHGNYAISYQNPNDKAYGAFLSSPKGIDMNTLKAIKSENTEGGFLVTKCPAFMGQCSLDATYFRDKLTNEVVVTAVSNLALPEIVAHGSALYNGVSINADDAPARHVQIHANGVIQHDYLLSYTPAGSTINYASYPIANSPKYTTNLGVTTDFGSNEKLFEVTPGFWWQYVGTRYLFSNVVAAPTKESMPGYGVVNFNMNATLNGLGHIIHSVPSRMSSAPVQMSFGVENLFNKRYDPTAYITSGGYFGTSFGGYKLVDPGAPREFIVSINFGTK